MDKLCENLSIIELNTISKSFLSRIKDKPIRELLELLLNAHEENTQLISSLKEENQELKDEINRLKGEQGKPKFNSNKGQKDKKNTNHSSEKERKNRDKGEKKDRKGKKENLPIDSVVKCEISKEEKSELPDDTYFLRYETRIQQDLKLVRENTEYQIAVYYSPSVKKTYRAKLPDQYVGKFGTNLKSLVHTMTHLCDVTQSKLLALLEASSISMSQGSLNNILKEESSMFQIEHNEILKAGLSLGYCGMDSTGSKQKGLRLYTQILTNHLFTAFTSRKSKSRQSVLSVLMNVSEEELQLAYTAHGKKLLVELNVSKADRAIIDQLLEDDKVYSKKEMDELISKKFNTFKAKKNSYARFQEALTIGHYHAQEDFPTVLRLITDNAGEYKKIAALLHALCWVHDGRDFKKLVPKIEYHRELLDDFLQQYWVFYHKLLDYKANPVSADMLEIEFDALFTTQTGYFQLDELIERTHTKKEKLLAVLEYPQFPLHNNDSELAARKLVQIRNIKMHTFCDIGTKIRDAALTMIETAKKNNVNITDYFYDRISGKNEMTSLANLIYQNSS